MQYSELHTRIRQELQRGRIVLRKKALVRQDAWLRSFREWKMSGFGKVYHHRLRVQYEFSFFGDTEHMCLVDRGKDMGKIVFPDPTQGQVYHLPFLLDWIRERMQPLGFLRYESEEWSVMLVEEGIQHCERYYLMERGRIWQRFLPSRLIRSDRIVLEVCITDRKAPELSIRYFPHGDKPSFSGIDQLLERMFAGN